MKMREERQYEPVVVDFSDQVINEIYVSVNPEVT